MENHLRREQAKFIVKRGKNLLKGAATLALLGVPQYCPPACAAEVAQG